MKGALAFDTSNYTTSTAFYSPEGAVQSRKLLSVESGALGLRQSDAVFHHVKRLPAILNELYATGKVGEICAVGASTAPRETEGSYMPCFLVGAGHASAVSRALGVPLYQWSHQQGHLAAAALGAGRVDLLEQPFLAWHLSGGTTELLEVAPQGSAVTARVIGGSSDISAGQFIDRAGVAMGLDFPAGPALERLSQQAEGTIRPFKVKNNGVNFSLSGMENKVREFVDKKYPREEIARFVLDTLGDVLCRVTCLAQQEHADRPVLFSGGVSSNQRLKAQLSRECDAVFSSPEYATDNAIGVAFLTYRKWEEEHGR